MMSSLNSLANAINDKRNEENSLQIYSEGVKSKTDEVKERVASGADGEAKASALFFIYPSHWPLWRRGGTFALRRSLYVRRRSAVYKHRVATSRAQCSPLIININYHNMGTRVSTIHSISIYNLFIFIINLCIKCMIFSLCILITITFFIKVCERNFKSITWSEYNFLIYI